MTIITKRRYCTQPNNTACPIISRPYRSEVQHYRREGVMESIQKGKGYRVNTGGKGLWSPYRREGVMESIQEGRGYGVNTG